jgi:pimeloyl-ACP methyl ester carboxylesterase
MYYQFKKTSMKKNLCVMLIVLVSAAVSGQGITGDWNGVLEVQGSQLPLIFHISRADGGYRATMDSPLQGAKDIPVTSVSYEEDTVKLSVAPAGLAYEGVVDADGKITGTFKQGELSLPLTLSKARRARPQEPSRPYPYYEEEVFFDNAAAGVRLAGTLTLPAKEGTFPAVVLISGSGKQNRDEEAMGHKPFLVLSDYLTRNGIAVLRYDERGVAPSTGVFETATTLDFSYDAEAGVNYLSTRKEIDADKIGLIGHSEGGAIAPMIAVRSPHVAFIVLMAGTGIPGDELLLQQQALIGRASGMSDEMIQLTYTLHRRVFDVVIQSTDTAQLATDLEAALKQLLVEYPDLRGETNEDVWVRSQIKAISSPWIRYFIRHDPAEVLEKVKVPVLAIGGEKDLQVPPQVNLQAIGESLAKGGNKQVTLRELPGLNHLFQACQTGLPAEYVTIEETLSPMLLGEILTWIKVQTQ